MPQRSAAAAGRALWSEVIEGTLYEAQGSGTIGGCSSKCQQENTLDTLDYDHAFSVKSEVWKKHRQLKGRLRDES